MSKPLFIRHALFLCLMFMSAIASAAPHAYFPMTPQPPVLGARVVDMASQELEELGLDHGVRVLAVAPGGPASQAGLAAGDILQSVSAKPVYSVERLSWLLRQAEADKPIKLKFQRGAHRHETDIQLRSSTPTTPWPGGTQGLRQSYMGVMLQGLNPGLREAFGVPQGKGALVSRVQEKSPAEKAGIQPGDVIIRLDRNSIQGVSDLRRAVTYFAPGDQVEVEIIRDSSPRTLNLTLEARPSRQEQALRWQNPNAGDSLQDMLPPPEYWRLLMDRMMRSMQDSWGELRDHWPEDVEDYY